LKTFFPKSIQPNLFVSGPALSIVRELVAVRDLLLQTEDIDAVFQRAVSVAKTTRILQSSGCVVRRWDSARRAAAGSNPSPWRTCPRGGRWRVYCPRTDRPEPEENTPEIWNENGKNFRVTQKCPYCSKQFYQWR